MDCRAIAAAALFLAACGQDSCFAGGTLISTPRGRRRIRDLAVGDEVWSFDPTERKFAVGTVAVIHRARGEVRTVRTSRGAIGAVTASHPIFIASREAFAADVQVSETVLAWDDDPAIHPILATVLELAPVAPGDTIEVFNLTVADAFSTYFADGFFVHNKESFDCNTAIASILVDHTTLCVGEATPLNANGSAFGPCTDQKFVFATSDPAVLGIEDGAFARGNAPGTVNVTLLVNGKQQDSVSFTVRTCATDAGADAPTDAVDTDASGTDASVADAASSDGDAADAATDTAGD